MKFLVLGGTALTGPHVIRQLVGHHVTTLSRNKRQIITEKTVKGDRLFTSNIERALISSDPDVVIDMVPFTVDGARALVDAFAEWGKQVPVVALSSIDVYASYARIHNTEQFGQQITPAREDAQLRTQLGAEGAAYDKIGIERLYQDTLEDLTTIRAPVVYGWPDGTRIASYFEPMLEGKTSIEIAQDLMSFRISRSLHKNVAHAICLAAQARPKGHAVFNVAEPPQYSELEWAQRIARLAGWEGSFEPGPNYWPHEPEQDVTADSTAIRDALGYTEIYDPEEGLRDALAFWSHHRSGWVYQKGY